MTMTIITTPRAPKETKKDGFIPAVYYGAHAKSTPIFIDAIEFKKVLTSAGESSSIVLKTEHGNENAMIQDVQLDPVIWSLVIELRFSALFLALAALCRRSPVALVGLSLVAWAIGRALMWKLGVGAPYQIGGSALGSLALTLFYRNCSRGWPRWVARGVGI